jgi:hypothetical protein
MNLSRILMILALALLAYLVYITMTTSAEVKPTTSSVVTSTTSMELKPTTSMELKPTTSMELKPTTINTENFSQAIPYPIQNKQQMMPKVNSLMMPKVESLMMPKVESSMSQMLPEMTPFTKEQLVQNKKTPNQKDYTEQLIQYNTEEKQNISYENFADISGITDNLYGAAPFGTGAPVNEGDMAPVNYTGLVDAQPGDVIQIEGTDLLTAPLVDNMLYTNSIANTNRNASQDLRGDIPLQFNDNYTPFYSSVIYGAPLSQHNMTINKM